MKLSFKINSLLALLFVGSASLLAQDDPFPEVLFRLYQGSMTITAQVVQNGQTVTDAIVAVYYGETIRGKENVGSGTNPQLAYLTVYGNTTLEEQQLYFKVYTGGMVFTYTPPTPIIFKNNSSIGTGAAPYIITLPVPVSLDDNGDNSSLLTTYNTQTCDVVLSSRKLYKDGDWNTLCLPFSLTAEQMAASPLAGAEARTLSSASYAAGTLTLNFSDPVESLTAGTPYIIKWEKAIDYVDDDEHNIKNPIFYGVTIDNSAEALARMTVTSEDGVLTFTGTYGYQSFTQEDKSILLVGTENSLYYPLSGASLGAFRAYFQLNGITARDVSGSSVKMFFGEEENETSLTPNPSPRERGTIYDLSGRKVANGQQPMSKGLYIVNGKKMLINK